MKPTYPFETTWERYIREQVPKDIAKGKTKMSYSTNDLKYQWNYVMPLWEKVCTIVVFPITAPVAFVYFCLEIPSFIIKLCKRSKGR